MNHKLSEWANIAEIIGAVAIIISLIYVSIQVRDNTNASAEVYQLKKDDPEQ
jgi:hypothetical protein